ncbi:amidase [Mycobacterium riyadhense]|uniref:amidase n=1 Tax=Mycobacterium riyadhense TaxID=486698 RepID=A0A1X2DC69_9MYCO|nr:amidase family protein [Mycobacterium riyadhense]MCV7146694.1 amidase [Mycobacterium riyadhense]ORW85708.1 amidase [Mycobacterium riyadhense]
MSELAEQTRWMDATDQARLVAMGEVTASELLEAAIERIEQSNPALNAVVIEWFDHARSAAADPDLPGGPFRGVPFLLKDLYTSFAGQTLSNGNVALKEAGKIDVADTTLVARFKAAGLVIAGRTNSSEMGSLPTAQPLAWGPTRNPWALDRTSGGSSGGAAAAVAAGMVPFANASDGGGSIRIPASCCGLVGLKPSQGRTTMGPIRAEAGLGVELCVSRTVRDTAGLLDAVRGPGVGDTVIAPAPQRRYVEEVGADPGRLRIGMLDVHPRGEFLHQDCIFAVRAAASLLEGLGHLVEPAWPAVLADTMLTEKFMTLWSTQLALAARRFSETLGREVTADDIEPVNWALIERAQLLSAVEYAAAQDTVWAFRRALQRWWAHGWDVLLTPTVAEPPLPLSEFENNPEHPTAPMRRGGQFAAFTPPFNMSGQPAISLPLHRNADGLPIGIQLVSAYGREDILIRVATQLESAQPWSSDHPTIRC